jgi:hypothetical protein
MKLRRHQRVDVDGLFMGRVFVQELQYSGVALARPVTAELANDGNAHGSTIHDVKLQDGPRSLKIR